MAGGKTRSLFSIGWRNVREAGWQRLALTALLLGLALLVGRFSWGLPVLGDAEARLFDSRAYELAERVEQDPRVVMVVYDDDTLIGLRKRSPLDRRVLANALRQLDGMGAKAIGIDILFDQPQDEDEELIAALRAMRTPTSVAYAQFATNENSINWAQQQYLDAFIARLDGSRAHPASVRLDEGVGPVRKWPAILPGLPPLLGRAMLEDAGQADATLPGYTGMARYRLEAVEDVTMYPEFKIEHIPELADAIHGAIEGSYVLIGGDLTDIDRVLTPMTATTDTDIPGLEFHAVTISQMLDNDRPRTIPAWVVWLWVLLAVLAAGLTALTELKGWRVVPVLAVQLVLLLGLPYLLHWQGFDTLGFPSFGPVIGWLLAFVAVTSAVRAASAVQRKFAQGALGKYLPASIAQEIIDKPELLQLGGAKAEIFVMFSDLEGFTKMSHAISPEMVAKLLNRYLDTLSEVVLAHGGILDKFVGDAVVAFWGAPIARPDDGTRAAQCGYAVWQAGEAFRAEVAAMDASLPPIGKTRVGLHWGEAVVGNFGGENRIQYTALGDSMNTAARLESANKALASAVMASHEFASRSGLDWWRPMGRVVLRGRARPVDIFEPAPDFSKSDRDLLAKALAMLASDRPQALALIADVAARNPADKALLNLLSRCNELDEEGAYVLD
ncbi:MAG: adenylate/guanylate cyclase domain-containing protein [Alteraurantiacibacter sp.]